MRTQNDNDAALGRAVRKALENASEGSRLYAGHFWWWAKTIRRKQGYESTLTAFLDRFAEALHETIGDPLKKATMTDYWTEISRLLMSRAMRDWDPADRLREKSLKRLAKAIIDSAITDYDLHFLLGGSCRRLCEWCGMDYESVLQSLEEGLNAQDTKH